MTIREMTPADATAVYVIERLSFPDPWSREGIASELDNRIGIALAAEENGVLTGYIFGECDGEDGYISHIAVDISHRRRGTAGQLLAAFLGRIPSGIVTLEVRKSNTAAISFYKSAGFEEIGTRRSFYSVPEREDAVVMRLQADH